MEAGNEILRIYNDKNLSQDVDYKSDNSPLTLADRASNEIIVSSIVDVYPEIPILSEEGKNVDFQERKYWNKFWLIDPLDGTKEFIKKNGR